MVIVQEVQTTVGWGHIVNDPRSNRLPVKGVGGVASDGQIVSRSIIG